MTSPVVTPTSSPAFHINGIWCWLLLLQLLREKTIYIIKTSPRSILVFSSGYYVISNTSVVNNYIICNHCLSYTWNTSTLNSQKKKGKRKVQSKQAQIKRTKSTKTSPPPPHPPPPPRLPKRGNRNTKRTENTRTKRTRKDTQQTAPQNKPQSNKEQDQHRDHRPRTASRETTGGGGGKREAPPQPANPTPGPDATPTQKYTKTRPAQMPPNLANAPKRKHKIKPITTINKDEHSWLTLLHARVN